MSQEVHRKRAGLGRGLSALLGDDVSAPAPQGNAAAILLLVAELHPDPDQPRRHFDEEALEELARSIREHGVLQPILVEPDGRAYRIIAGERRWRAAQRAQLHEIPAVVRSFTVEQRLEAALVENIQRRDLNAVEEAEAYNRLMVEFRYTQEEIAQRVHKSRSHVANLLRLLELGPDIRQSLVEGALTMGHARALLTAPNPSDLAKQVIERKLSVRQTEQLAKAEKPKPAKAEVRPTQDADAAALERHLRDLLGIDVRIAHAGRSGTVTLTYASLEQLDLICQKLSGDRI